MSVMLAIGLSLGMLAFKQEQLTSTALQTQDAFYAADAGLECALYADQKQDMFNYDTYMKTHIPPAVSCEGLVTSFSSSVSGADLIFTGRMPIAHATECADITVYKPSSSDAQTYIYSQGYNVPCSTVTNATAGSDSFASQGLEAYY